MSLSQGRQYLAIPGPSVMPEEVLRAMHRASPNIYEGELIEMTASMIPDLKWVAQTDGQVAIYICNGHGTWEAALANTVARGETVLVPATGRFGHGWGEVARTLGIKVQVIEAERGQPADPEAIEQALRADTEGRIKAVLVTHVDTSTSVRSNVAEIRRAIDAAGHPALLMSDNIASLACDVFRMDAWGVDVMIAASQKGLMVPPGLGFVWFSDKAAAARRALTEVSGYWDWTQRANPEMFYQYFYGTAPTHHLYGLRVALDMLKAEGLDAVWARHATLARAIWAAAETWGQGGPCRLTVPDAANRSHAVTALRLGAPYGRQLRAWTDGQAGVTLGIGLGMSEPGDEKGEGYFRFGHMGHVNAQMIMGLLGSVEAGLSALQIPHGAGALSKAAAVIAQGDSST